MLVPDLQIDLAAEFEAARVRSSLEERIFASSRDENFAAGCSKCECDGAVPMGTAGTHSKTMACESIGSERRVRSVHPSSKFFCSTCWFIPVISGWASSRSTMLG